MPALRPSWWTAGRFCEVVCSPRKKERTFKADSLPPGSAFCLLCHCKPVTVPLRTSASSAIIGISTWQGCYEDKMYTTRKVSVCYVPSFLFPLLYIEMASIKSNFLSICSALRWPRSWPLPGVRSHSLGLLHMQRHVPRGLWVWMQNVLPTRPLYHLSSTWQDAPFLFLPFSRGS